MSFPFQRVEDHRKKWDKDEYERLATERLQAELEKELKSEEKLPPVKRELLKQRDYRVDLDSKLGKSVVITKNTPTSQSGGMFPLQNYSQTVTKCWFSFSL